MMSAQPVKRLGYRHRLFSYCGVDYVGPFYVTILRSSEKDGLFRSHV